MIKSNKTFKRIKLSWMGALILFVLFYTLFNNNRTTLILGITMICLFSVYAIENRGKMLLKFDAYILYMLVFGLYCYISALWAENSGYATNKGELIIELLIAMWLMKTVIAKDSAAGFDNLLRLIKWGSYIVLIYTIAAFGWSNFVYIVQNNIRLSNDINNANSIGMCAAFAVVINFYYTLYEGFRISDAMMIPGVVIIAAAGSRKGLVVLVAGCIALLILKNFDNKKLLNSIGKVAFTVIIGIVLMFFVLQLPMFNNLLDRLFDLGLLLAGKGTRDTSGWSRLQYIKLGIDIFKEHPIAGIGIDNARLYTKSLYGVDHYLHNNFVEMLACGGMIGFVIYYSIYAYILTTLIRNRQFRDKEWDICFVLLMINLAMDYGRVSYLEKETYVYLLLYWLEVNRIKDMKRKDDMVSRTIIAPA